MYKYMSVYVMVMSVSSVYAAASDESLRKKEAFWTLQRMHASCRVPSPINAPGDTDAREVEIKRKAEEILRQATPTNDVVRDVSAFIVSDMNKNEAK